MIRKLGYIHREPSLFVKAGSAVRSRRVPDSFEPTRHPEFAKRWTFPLDQGETSACTGFWAAKAYELTILVRHGVELQISPLAAYYWGRARLAERNSSGQPIVDDSGAYTGDVLWAANSIGVCPERSWPQRRHFAEHVNDAPGLDCVSAAKRTRQLYPATARQIVASGERLVQRVLHSLDLGQYVGVAVPVSHDFMDDQSSVVRGLGNDYGLHQVGVIDWRKTEAGEFELLVANSWGAGWGGKRGDGVAPLGCRWASSAFVAQAVHACYLEARNA